MMPQPAHDSLDTLNQRINLRLRSIQLDNNQCGSTPRIAGIGEILSRIVARPSIISIPAGMIPAQSHHQRRCRTRIIKSESSARWLPASAKSAKSPRTPRKQPFDLSSPPVGRNHRSRCCRQAQDLAIHCHHLNAEEVVGRQPIFKAMHPT